MGEVSKVQEAQLPADLMSEIEDYGELGYSESADDSLIPILGILQDNSGEVKKKHERHIEGAEAGDMIVRSLQRVYKADLDAEGGILFQPCGFQHMWVEWSGEPGDGAVVGQYLFDERPPEAQEVQDPENPDRKVWKMPSGNRLVDTRYHFGHIVTGDEILPCVIPFGGTNHTVSRQWTSLMKQKKHNGRRAPAFFHVYRIGTQFQQRGSQSWYKYQIREEGPMTDESILRAGFDLMKSITEQKVSADVSSEGDEKVVEDSPID